MSSKRVIAVMNKELQHENFGNISQVVYNKYSTRRLPKFEPIFFFCDNIVVWCTEEVTHNDIRTVFNAIGIAFANPSRLNSEVTRDSNIIPEINIPYVSYKVSLSREPMERLINILINNVEYLNIYNIYIHDIDISVDCLGSTTRDDVYNWITQHMGVDPRYIVNDRHKVGNNCISWYAKTGDINLKIKVYNKFVQMLESSDVRTYVGSRVSSIVASKSPVMRDTLERSKGSGLTRIEIKVYSTEIFEYKSYYDLMKELLERLRDCLVYKTSFENQWKALVDDVYDKRVLMVYDKDTNTFGYYHWYNSMTNRKQGLIKEGMVLDSIMTLVSNYSFNGRDTLLIEISGESNVERVFRRTTYSITLVPSPNNSLYPSMQDYEGCQTFDSMGLVDYRGMRIGWPQRIRQLSPPLANIIEILPNGSSSVQHLGTIINPNRNIYRAAHVVLSPNFQYQVTSIGYSTYRGNNAIFADVVSLDGSVFNVRCGDSFVGVINSINPLENIFDIRTGSIVREARHGHVIDIKVFLVSI